MIHASEEHIDQIAKLQLINKEMLKQSFLKKMRNRDDLISVYEVRKKKIKHLPEQIPKIEELICPICLEIFQKVTITQCGHSFCEMCILNSLMRKAECPVCRVKIKTHSFQYCESFDNRINYLIHEYGSEDQIQTFQNRQEDTKKWNQSRQVDNLSAGQKVDIMDSQFIWCEATIKSVDKKEIFIHYDGWGPEYDEFISINSHRIAPYGFFTSRSDIPKYDQQLMQLTNIIEYINQRRGQLQ